MAAATRLDAPPLISSPEGVPLTSEPPLADAAPLTSEPPLAGEQTLTSEPAGFCPCANGLGDCAAEDAWR